MYGNNGVIGNSNNVSYVTGKVGQAIKFRGVDAPTQITVQNDSSLQFGNEFTVAYWLKMDNLKGEEGSMQSTVAEGIHAIFAKEHDKEGNMYSYLSTSSGTINFGTGNQGESVNGTFTVGNWVHVAQVISGNNIKMFLNGDEVLNETLTQAFDFTVANSKNLTIGRLGNGWYPLYGTLDEFRMYNKAITESEVEALYQQGL